MSRILRSVMLLGTLHVPRAASIIVILAVCVSAAAQRELGQRV